MSGNEPLSFASVREYMLKNDGKVRNHDLVTHFRQQLNDPANKSMITQMYCFIRWYAFKYWHSFLLDKVRGDFKDIVHQLATVQEIDVRQMYYAKFIDTHNLDLT